MLRIITEQRGNTFHLDLHGTVADEGIAVLDEHWRGIVEKVPSAVVDVDLSNVAFIDAHGERLLRRMAQCGVAFDAGPGVDPTAYERVDARRRAIHHHHRSRPVRCVPQTR